MTAYFPKPLPDELLYSVLARCARHLGSPGEGEFSRALFGSARVVAAIDLPSSLGLLAGRLGSSLGASAGTIAERYTLLPYLAAFRPHAERDSACRAMTGARTNLHVRLGLAASTIAAKGPVRFCPACDAQALETYGERFWRRAHRLPGVVVCPDHGVVLRASRLDPADAPRNGYVAATAASCPADATAVCAEPEDAVRRRLLQIARASAALLREHAAEPGRAGSYREALASVGLMRSRAKVDLVGLRDAFSAFHGDALLFLPGVSEADGRCGSWLEAIFRTHRKAFQPLQHVLVRLFLESLSKVSSPFGEAPWACVNPLARHRDRRAVGDLACKRDRGSVTGTFTCRCGYVYTRRLHPDGALGPPRFKAYGPTLEPALRELLVPGATRRGVAKAIGLDAKTMSREVVASGLDAPWDDRSASRAGPAVEASARSTAEADQPPVDDVVAARPGAARRSGPRRDWPAIDAATSPLLEPVARRILDRCPPTRITFVELERGLAEPGWLRRRRRVLPSSFAEALRLVERDEVFRGRRIEHAVDRWLACGGRAAAWRLVREAGLRSTDLDLVKSAMVGRLAGDRGRDGTV